MTSPAPTPLAKPTTIARLEPLELARRLAGDRPPVVLDVRRRDTWATEGGRVPGALWLPLEEIPERARDLPRETPIVVYCS
jgi:rhodanese-related sulfurtransferase